MATNQLDRLIYDWIYKPKREEYTDYRGKVQYLSSALAWENGGKWWHVISVAQCAYDISETHVYEYQHVKKRIKAIVAKKKMMELLNA